MWYRYSKFKYKPVSPFAMGFKTKTKKTKSFADDMQEDITDKSESQQDDLESIDSGLSDIPGLLPDSINKPASPDDETDTVLIDSVEPPVQSKNINPIKEPIFNPIHDNCKCGQRIQQMISGKKVWTRTDSMCNACKAAADAFDAQQDNLYPDPPVQI